MFERYTEKARRSIFFARYEASVVGATEIEVEHFLLGVLREDRVWRERVPVEEIRKRILEHLPANPKISVSVDLPLSRKMKRVLAHGALEAEREGHQWIDTQHHLLGILGEPSFAADLLREHGLNEDALRTGTRLPAPQTNAAALASAVSVLVDLLHARAQMSQFASAAVAQRPDEKSFDENRKEAIGHLIDCAAAFHQWLPQALAGNAGAFDFPARGRLAEYYRSDAWIALLELWMGMHKLMIHILCQVPENAAETVATAATAYATHCSEVIAAIG